MSGSHRRKDSRRKKRVKKWYAVILTVISCMIIIAIILIPLFKKQSKMEEIYSEAITLLERQDYVGAYDLLETIAEQDYKETTSFMYFCSAKMLYESGNVEGAYKEIKKASFSDETKEKLSEIDKLSAILEEEYKSIKVSGEEIESNRKDQVYVIGSGKYQHNMKAKTAEEELYEENAEIFSTIPNDGSVDLENGKDSNKDKEENYYIGEMETENS